MCCSGLRKTETPTLVSSYFPRAGGVEGFCQHWIPDAPDDHKIDLWDAPR